MKNCSFIIPFVFLISVFAYSQNNELPEYLHSPKELSDIMENSALTYEIEDFDPDEFSNPVYKTISMPLTYTEIEGTLELKYVDVNEDAKVYYDSAETLYGKQKYEEAAVYYRKALEIEPDNSLIITNLGDMYYMLEDYEKAKEYFLQAIQKNYFNYQAHWFLADALKKLSEFESAFDENVIAHILNRNNAQIKASIIECAEKMGRTWKDYGYNPRFTVNQNPATKNIVIKANEDWLAYAMAVAVWMYEPGLCKKYSGYDYDEDKVNNTMEFACFWANFESPKQAQFKEALSDSELGISSFLYEIILRKNPFYIYSQSKDSVLQLLQYVKKYHLN